MRVISTSEFRDELAKYIDKIVSTDTPLLVGRYGKPLIKIIPAKDEKVNYEKYYGFMGDDLGGREFVNNIRRSSKEKEVVRKLRNG